MKVIGLMTDFELSRNIAKKHDKMSMYGGLISQVSDEAYLEHVRAKYASCSAKLTALKDFVALHRPHLIHELYRSGFW
jgi:hypothetical protein